MNEFTIKNIFKYWCRLWPLSVVLIIIGCSAGLYTVTKMKPSYESVTSLLVQNESLTNPNGEYLAILNSDLTINELDLKDCQNANKQVGNVITIDIICKSEENVGTAMQDIRKKFDSALHNIYTDAKLVEISQTKDATVQNVSMGMKIKKFIVPVIAMLALSFAISFVVFDYKTSKRG